MKLNKYISIWLVAVAVVFSSCDEDDATGHSSVTPTSPTITVTAPTITAVTDEAGTDYVFTVAMSETQIVDVAVWITQTAGDATEDADFALSTHKLVIPAFTTSASFTVSILADAISEETESFTLTIGDSRTANATITPVDASFTINDYDSDDLTVTLSWDADLTDLSGSHVDPTVAADLRLLITDAAVPYTTVVTSVDGGSFEELSFAGTEADGDYYIVADFFSATDYGDQGFFDVDVTVGYSQAGVIDGESISFSGALNTFDDCTGNHFYVAQITKTGTSYAVSPIGTVNTTSPTMTAGTYDVVSNGQSTDGGTGFPTADDHPYVVTVTEDAGTYTISDGVAGVYILWYSGYGYTFETAGTYSIDVCGNVTGSWATAFTGDTVNLSGTRDADGSMSVDWVNAFGDTCSAVYTIQ